MDPVNIPLLRPSKRASQEDVEAQDLANVLAGASQRSCSDEGPARAIRVPQPLGNQAAVGAVPGAQGPALGKKVLGAQRGGGGSGKGKKGLDKSRGLPIQLAPPLVRTRDKFVPLPVDEPDTATHSRRLSLDNYQVPTDGYGGLSLSSSGDEKQTSRRGRIGVYCIAESFRRKKLEAKVRVTLGALPDSSLHNYPDVVHCQYSLLGSRESMPTEHHGDIFFFDYGVVVAWGLSQEAEHQLVRSVALPCAEGILDHDDSEADAFEFHYSKHEKPNISNDTITISWKHKDDHTPKMSISHALAQSTKLLKFESRVAVLVDMTKDMPGTLATTGKVNVSRKRIAQLIGKVFIQKAAVNLLSSVLDTPTFFWSAPDSQQALYKRCTDYLELDTRVEVLNTRFAVLTEMLHIVADHMNNSHTSRLEWIVIWLIVVEVFVGLFECASILGWVG